MKQVIEGFTMVFLLLIYFIGPVNAQTDYSYDAGQIDIARSIKYLFTMDMDKGFQKIRGKQLPDEEGSVIMYDVVSAAVKMHADAQYVVIRKGNPMALYFAIYGEDTAFLNKSLYAFKSMSRSWHDSKLVNPFTVKKDETASKDGKVVYLLYSQGLKVGIYSLDENQKTGQMIIGFLDTL